eukprot:GHVR01165891.1.p1 GENE.GHVR01165891.1~~GHVR01165891.1.p1  ORF type:complete len:396 (+),score=106.82 GHVR01165891.1:192-1379(+)
MSTPADHQQYVQTKINPLLEPLVTQALLDRPDDLSSFIIKWLCDKTPDNNPLNDLDKLKKENIELKAIVDKYNEKKESLGGYIDPSSDEEEEDDVGDLPEFCPVQRGGPRTSVSAEAYGSWNKKKEFDALEYPKTDEQKNKLVKVLKESFLFNALEDNDLDTVVLAMQEKTLQAKERPINQGEDGDCLYFVDKGELDCYIKLKDTDDEICVKTCTEGDVFGELALLYNCPRAASVESRDESVVWILGRDTFNAIVKDSASKRRDLYDQFLSSVLLFNNMDAYERSKIADALNTEIFSEGEYIVKQGEAGDKFFLVEKGEAYATKSFAPGEPAKEVMQYKRGDYFGELALLKNEPRAANIIAKDFCRCASLNRASFKRLLGPLEDILTRAQTKYEQ